MANAIQVTDEERRAHLRVTRMRPVDGTVAIFKAMRNPESTEQIIRFIGAMGGRSADPSFERFVSTEVGLEALRRDTTLLDVLLDRDRLRSMPPGTLGREYVDWSDREGISSESLEAESKLTFDLDYEKQGPWAAFGARVRDMHDLIHVVTGYDRTLIGETGVITFTFAQTRHRGIGLLLLIGYFNSFLPNRGLRDETGAPQYDWNARREIRRRFRTAFRHGRRADWIIGAHWEALLEKPLDEVRRMYSIEPVSGIDDASRRAAASRAAHASA